MAISAGSVLSMKQDMLATAKPLGVDATLRKPFEADALVDALVERLIQRPIDPEKRQVLLDAANQNSAEETIRHVVQLIVSMPEYQLC